MKFIFVFSALFLTIASQNANSIDVGSGDMVSSPAIHVTATLEDDVLSVTTSWTILRDNNCDVYRKQETTRSARGIAVDITISCTHRRVCGSVRGPGPAVPISCDVFNKNM